MRKSISTKGYLATALAVFVAVVTFSDHLVKLRDNIYKLFIGEPAKITLTNATSTISKDAPSIMPVRFIVVVEHENKDIRCSGEGSGGEGSGPDLMLSSKDSKISIAEGKQSKRINLEIPGTEMQNFKFDLVNFRLDCDHFGKTPYIPVDVIAQNIPVNATAQNAEPQRPPSAATKSFKVCAGNGGGPSCQATSDAYYTCAQYRNIGGGAQTTYDTLGKRFCEYKQDGNSILAPYKVLHDFSVAGGECGWTGFTVICNP
jgi:hypothetical protein